MISNVSKFPKEAQPQIKERIDFLYKYQTQKYLMGESAFDSVQYNEYKTGLIDFGMNADNSYTPVFKFIETHALCDTDSFLTLCENDFSSLSTEMLTLLLYQFSNLLPDDNDQAKLRGAKFIRSLLPSLDANTIYWTATQLMKLENGDKH